ncbi:hypothetical protein EV182_007750, partial [Spiromyces aspiralis]
MDTSNSASRLLGHKIVNNKKTNKGSPASGSYQALPTFETTPLISPQPVPPATYMTSASKTRFTPPALAPSTAAGHLDPRPNRSSTSAGQATPLMRREIIFRHSGGSSTHQHRQAAATNPTLAASTGGGASTAVATGIGGHHPRGAAINPSTASGLVAAAATPSAKPRKPVNRTSKTTQKLKMLPGEDEMRTSPVDTLPVEPAPIHYDDESLYSQISMLPPGITDIRQEF